MTLAAVPVVSWAADQVAQGGAEPNSTGQWTQGQLEAQTANTYWKNLPRLIMCLQATQNLQSW